MNDLEELKNISVSELGNGLSNSFIKNEIIELNFDDSKINKKPKL